MSTVKTYSVDSGDATNLTLKTNGTAAVTVDSSQNVGIGTSSPDAKLEITVGDSGGINIEQSGASQTGYLTFRDSDGGLDGRVSYDHSTNAMRFTTATTERMRITSNGGVSFGSSGTAYGSSGQVLTSNGNAAPTWSTTGSGTVTSVAMTVPSFLTVTGSPITSSGTLAVTLSGTALPVANGGTGVTSSSGANSVVLRDANNNITANAYFNGFTSVAASGTQITLTVASTPVYLVTG
jgi:hypothetical protein